MPTDDEILERVQHRATAIRRRQRLLVAGAASVVVVALLGGAVVAGTVPDDGADPVDVADTPDDGGSVDPTTAVAPTTDGACDGTARDPDLGSATAGPGGSRPAPTDGSGSEDASTPSTTADSLLAQGDQAGAPPTESSRAPDDPSAVTLPTVEASSTACPLQVEVVATYDTASGLVGLAVTATAEPRYEAHGSVVWDAADPVQEDLGAMERSPGSCDATGDATAAPVQGDFAASHVYPSGGEKQVTIEFWARRCDGPVHQVQVTVTVPL